MGFLIGILLGLILGFFAQKFTCFMGLHKWKPFKLRTRTSNVYRRCVKCDCYQKLDVDVLKWDNLDSYERAALGVDSI